MKLGMEVGLGPDHIVLDGDPAPPPHGHSPTIFRPCLLWPNGWLDQDGTGTEVGLGPDDIVLDGDPSPHPKRVGEQPPTIWSMYCGQTAGWIKMPLGTQVGLGPGHIVLDWDPAPPPQ